MLEITFFYQLTSSRNRHSHHRRFEHPTSRPATWAMTAAAHRQQATGVGRGAAGRDDDDEEEEEDFI
jgi:hypothetical protein